MENGSKGGVYCLSIGRGWKLLNNNITMSQFLYPSLPDHSPNPLHLLIEHFYLPPCLLLGDFPYLHHLH